MWKTSGREVILAFAMMEEKFFSEVSRLLAFIGVSENAGLFWLICSGTGTIWHREHRMLFIVK